MRWVIGIDEVGRGSLAGPVTVAAVAMPVKIENQMVKFKVPLRDSKKLTLKQREEWFRFLERHPSISCAVARIYPRNIERLNISQAANRAALRAYTRLVAKNHWCLVKADVFLDGSLYLKNSRWQAENSPKIFAKTVVKGDEKIPVVALASIVAKVARDRLMIRLAREYPLYGFEIHKGYATKLHRAMLKKHGPSEAHRMSFLKNSSA